MKMNRKTIFFNIISLFILSVNAQAAVIKQIYEVSLPVISQEKQIRGAAFEQGLIEVSVRVSGTSLAPTQIDLKQATRMVRQYHYKAMSQPEIDDYMKKTSTLVAPKYKLWMQFDGAKVRQLLRDNSMPIWGYQRPNVLVWLAVKDGNNRYLLKKSDVSQIKQAVSKEAKRRGLPVIWPEYDARDKKMIKFIDVWGEFWGPVKQASERYSVDAVVLGRMNWSKGSWTVNWSLLMEDRTESWKLTSPDLEILMGSGVGVATDQISSRFAVFAGNENDGEILLRVSDLNSVSKYAAASHYLSSLAPVKNVYATEVNQYQVDFHIELSGDESDLKRIIALGKVLVPDTRPDNHQEKKQVSADLPVDNSDEPTQQVLNENPDGDETGEKKSENELPETPKYILRYRLNG
ncbi:MAG: hypothetical protein DIZ80_14445 [endosymbiont of Galathealinum brachiosum]|uniref:DUF2066 domain-containing protein n=1 Tax=endosymbiont of Galathealinum brachiosum TaxID=2200906 RepID=A0A370D8T7_9GAMM|nr:MAG: hypothetical protein DIZ80_14445 [endosymbiont of Galathealinum brachiosum]